MNDGKQRVEQAIRFSKIWWQSRADAAKSQEYMALGLGVSKKTIQNWEKGIASPNLYQAVRWFQLLELNPMHYFLEFFYPCIFDENENDEANKDLEEALICLIKNSSNIEKKQLLYIISGNHGSSWYALLQLLTAHCHTSMQSRAATARLILDNYEIENKNNKLVCPEDILPDIGVLIQAISKGKIAAMENNNGYFIPKEDDGEDQVIK